jgi:hypothetical protein
LGADRAESPETKGAGRFGRPDRARAKDAYNGPGLAVEAPALDVDRLRPADIVQLQRLAGNSAVAALVGRAGHGAPRPAATKAAPAVQRLARAPKRSGVPADPTPEQASNNRGAGGPTLQDGASVGPARSAPGSAVSSPVAAGGAPGADAAPSGVSGAGRTDTVDGRSGGEGTDASGGGPGEGALGFLARLETAPPSAFAGQLAEARTAGGAALETERQASSLDPKPVPSGLEPGVPIAPPPVPEVPAPSVDGPVPSGGAGGGATLEPSGDTDPAQADHWARAATVALDASASATAAPAPPALAGRLRPTEQAGELPKVMAPAVPALPGVGPAPAADGEAAAALDLNMGPSLAGTVSEFLAPAGTASSAHAKEVAAVKASTETGLSQVQTDTKRRQEAAATAADQQVAELYGSWGMQRAAILKDHKARIEAESGQARNEASQTITEANNQARTHADEAEKAQPEGEEKSSGWWGRIKSAGRAVAGAVKGIASSVLSIITSIIARARQTVVGIIKRLGDAIKQRLDAALQAITSVAKRVWSAMATAIKKAQAVATKLATTAAALARKLWETAKARLAAAWDILKRAAKAALDAAKAVVNKIASALRTLREILKILKNGMLEKLFELAKDPRKLAQPVIDKVAPLVGQVPAKADALALEKGKEAGTPAHAGPPVQRVTVQRQSAAPAKSTGDQAAELILEGHIREPDSDIPPPAPGEGFWGGVWRHMKATGNHFLQNWETTLVSLVYSLLLFYPVLLQEGPKLWQECKGVIFGGGGVDRFDHVLGVLRHLVNIVAGLVATTGIWALIIGAFTGPGEAIVVGAYEAISLGVIAADVTLGLAEMGKAWYSATRAGISTEIRERYLSMFSGSAVATAINIVLVVLGAVASRLARAFKARRAAAAAGEAGEGAKGGGERPSADGGERPAGADKPPAAAGQQHGIGDSNPRRAGELVNEEAAKGAQPEQAGGHEVWKTREGCVVCSDPCDFLGGKFRDKFSAGTPESAEFTRRFHQMEAMADGPAKTAAEKALVTDLEAAPTPIPTQPGTVGALHIEPGVTLSPSELAAAEFWANQGRSTTAVKPSTVTEVRTADLNVEGIGRIDVYTPEAATSANRVVGAVLKKGSQTSMVHIEMAPGSVVTPAEVARFPARIFGHPTAGKAIKRILVRQNGGVLLDEVRR